MFSVKVPAEEQNKLIMECRQRCLSDQQWCLNHDIKPGTFYNLVKRFAKEEDVLSEHQPDVPVKRLLNKRW